LFFYANAAGDINGDGIADCIDNDIDGDGVINTDGRLWLTILNFCKNQIFFNNT
jgi:hypothetical protein